MHNQLLTGKVKHGISSACLFPRGVSQGGVVGERSDRPFGVSRAEVMGVKRFGNAVKHACGGCARERNVWCQLIPVAWGVWVWRGLAESDERAVPDGSSADA